MQSWFFFGLIAEIIGQRVDAMAFLQLMSSRPY